MQISLSLNLKKIVVMVLIIVFFIGFLVLRSTTTTTTTTTDYPLINKAVTAGLGKYFLINFIPLRDKIMSIQKKYPQKTYIYFVYLNNSSWIGLSERENFTAASTIKVPLAMAFYKAVEDKKLSLDDNFIVQEIDLDNSFGGLYKRGFDYTINTDEVLNIMLGSSDNTAKNIIWRALDEIGITDPLGDVYRFFGWVFEVGESPTYGKINLKILSNMFIALYNAKYVNIEHSQKILEILSKTPFNEKIAAGIPDSIVVSHKVGIVDAEKFFSDCGIVYAPNRHYILCLGSNGKDESAANKFMKEVSKTIYDYVISN